MSIDSKETRVTKSTKLKLTIKELIAVNTKIEHFQLGWDWKGWTAERLNGLQELTSTTKAV